MNIYLDKLKQKIKIRRTTDAKEFLQIFDFMNIKC